MTAMIVGRGAADNVLKHAHEHTLFMVYNALLILMRFCQPYGLWQKH